ncbi:hypothetical protein ACOSQ3_006708 [Xanthoceras sorbifolium]
MSQDCFGWAAQDTTGVLSPYHFKRRQNFILFQGNLLLDCCWAVGDDDVSLKITHCGICYGDVIYTRNKLGGSIYPVVPGHEIVGIVKEVGANVGCQTGDLVAVGSYVNSCRDCEECNEGLEVYCSKRLVPTFNSIDEDGTVTKGGYSNFMVVHERYCFKIPDNYPLASAAPLLCAGITHAHDAP